MDESTPAMYAPTAVHVPRSEVRVIQRKRIVHHPRSNHCAMARLLFLETTEIRLSSLGTISKELRNC